MAEERDRPGFFARLFRRRRPVFPDPRQTHLYPLSPAPTWAFLVHGKCADGFTSAGLLLRKYPEGLAVYAQPHELATRLTFVERNRPTKGLVIADLSSQPGDAKIILESLTRIRRSGRVVWLDHHAPQWPESFEKELRRIGVETRIDREKKESGASLVAEWTGEKDPALLRVADLIRRRDAWTDPHDPDARAWTAVAGARGREYVWRLSNADLDGLEEEGRGLVARKDERVERILKKKLRTHSERVRWLWTEDDVSDVADRLFSRDPKAQVFVRFGKNGKVSLRSRDVQPVAAEVAQRFGGGGHANAAGLTLDIRGWSRLVYRIRRGKDPRVQNVLRAAEEAVDLPS